MRVQCSICHKVTTKVPRWRSHTVSTNEFEGLILRILTSEHKSLMFIMLHIGEEGLSSRLSLFSLTHFVLHRHEKGFRDCLTVFWSFSLTS